MTIVERITDTLVQTMGVPREQATPTACLYADLGFDSLDHAEFLIAVEDQFDLEFSDDEGERILTIDDAARTVAARLAVLA